MLYICEKFRENILNSFQLIQRTQVYGKMAVQCSKGKNSKSRQIRVTFYVFCMSSNSALHLCEVWWKISQTVPVMERKRMMEVLTDGRTLKISDALPLFVVGHKNLKCSCYNWRYLPSSDSDDAALSDILHSSGYIFPLSTASYCTYHLPSPDSHNLCVLFCLRPEINTEKKFNP